MSGIYTQSSTIIKIRNLKERTQQFETYLVTLKRVTTKQTALHVTEGYGQLVSNTKVWRSKRQH